MKQVIIKNGGAVVEKVPAPHCRPGCILIQVSYSCISVGTEMSGVTNSGLPLWKRALKQPDNVRKALKMVSTSGLSKTRSVVQGRLAAGSASGYSASGIVVAVGEGVEGFVAGNRVACAGAQCAHHAEYICVPENLTVLLPEAVDLDKASSVTLGAIALQGVRRFQPTLGEAVAVLGLGLLGQLTVQMLKANGCQVIGLDLDPHRLKIGGESGADQVFSPSNENSADQVMRLTNGYGADGVIITAATQSEEVLSSAFNMTRKKGRVVLVGDIPMNIKRAEIYKKELNFYISTSYGPGRYDQRYEENGMDYPLPYVRWTENRNMQAYLDLLARKKINLDHLINRVYSIDSAAEAYSDIKLRAPNPLMVLLKYRSDSDPEQTVIINQEYREAGTPSLALIGAGSFAKAIHLPNLLKLKKKARLAAVMGRSGHNAQSVAKQFSAGYATTSLDKILTDNTINTVMIATRHDTHGDLTLRSLESGKHVFVEKPLTLNRHELEEIKKYYSKNYRKNLLLVGYNRRFSKYSRKVKKLLKNRSNPMIVNYRMNAGYIPRDSWVQKKEGGGRNLGEACHIYDLFNYLTDAKVISIDAKSIIPKTDHYLKNDNFSAIISYDDGSVCNLIYTALGNKEYPKEHMEVYVDGKVFVMEDYKSLKTYGRKTKGMSSKLSKKGQFEGLACFLDSIASGGDWPIPLWQLIQASEISLRVEEILEKTSKSLNSACLDKAEEVV